MELERRPVATGVVRRANLVSRLSETEPGRVILVCAPAGTGKTVLIQSWVQSAGLKDRTAWVAVERGERDGQRFWLAVIDALADVLDEVRRVDPAPALHGEAVVDQLLADLRSLEGPAVLVIDDLHELASADALGWLERLLTRLPPRLRVVLATREDPRLGLHRLRLSGALSELRAHDLRFSAAEAGQLLRASGISLSEAGLAMLYERTEGWAAGLRLAAISLTNHPDPELFVRQFSGSERTVAGYLMAEVLERQPAEVRELLLRTSVLERVNGELADRLTGGSGSERILQELEESGAFVTSEDVSRSWFRYHHLFADLLRLELRRVAPYAIPALHRSAAAWFEEHGDVVSAVHHARAAGDWPHAARLLFEHRVGLMLDGRVDTMRALLEAFPAAVIDSDPELAISLAGLRLHDGYRAEAEAYLAIAEREGTRVPVERRALYELQLASVRLQLARQRGDLPGALEAARSLEAAVETDTRTQVERTIDIRAFGLLTLGVTELWALRLQDARRHLEAGLALARRINRPYLQIGCLAHLAIAAPLSGFTALDALGHTEEAVALAEEHGMGTDPVVALAFAIGGGSLAWLGRFAEAEQWLERGEEALHPEGEPATELALCHARGLLYSAQGRFEDAVAAFRAAQETQALLAGEHALTVDVRCELLLTQIRQGDLEGARAGLRKIPPEERDRAETRLPAAALELAEGRPEPAIERLTPVIDRSVDALVPVWSAIYALLIAAPARSQAGDRLGAETAIETALELAEPQGLILPFVIMPAQALLADHPPHRSRHGAFLATIRDVLGGAEPARHAQAAPLMEELSDAELRVVRYLSSNLRAREIAAELLVSTNTVRTHLRHIYAKLGAHDRAEAVARARELGLLAPSLRRR